MGVEDGHVAAHFSLCGPSSSGWIAATDGIHVVGGSADCKVRCDLKLDKVVVLNLIVIQVVAYDSWDLRLQE